MAARAKKAGIAGVLPAPGISSSFDSQSTRGCETSAMPEEPIAAAQFSAPVLYPSSWLSERLPAARHGVPAALSDATKKAKGVRYNLAAGAFPPPGVAGARFAAIGGRRRLRHCG